MTQLHLKEMFGEMPKGSIFEAMTRTLESQTSEFTQHLGLIQGLDGQRPNLYSQRNYGGLVALLFHSLSLKFLDDYTLLTGGWSDPRQNLEHKKKACAIILSFLNIGAYEYARQVPKEEFEDFLTKFNEGAIPNFFLLDQLSNKSLDKDLYAECVTYIYGTAKNYTKWILNDEQEGTKRFVDELRNLFIVAAVTEPNHEKYEPMIALLKRYFAMYSQQFSTT